MTWALTFAMDDACWTPHMTFTARQWISARGFSEDLLLPENCAPHLRIFDVAVVEYSAITIVAALLHERPGRWSSGLPSVLDLVLVSLCIDSSTRFYTCNAMDSCIIMY